MNKLSIETLLFIMLYKLAQLAKFALALKLHCAELFDQIHSNIVF